MNFENTRKELLNYLSNHNLFKIFLPFGTTLLLVSQITLLISIWGGIKLGIFEYLLTIFFYLGLIISLAKGNYQIISIASALRAIYFTIILIKCIRDPYLDTYYGEILYILLWLYFVVTSYKASKNNLQTRRAG